MNNRKGIIGLTLAVIMVASVFAVLPLPVVAQKPPSTPTEGDNQLINASILSKPPYGVTLRVYGEDDKGPVVGYDPKGQFVYPNWRDPFDPTALQKDSLTFNPALIKDEYGTMSVDDENVYLKKFLRLWYEPEHVYSKPTYKHPTIEVESTYMLIDAHNYTPTKGEAGVTWFVFPIAERPMQTGLSAFENPASNWTGLIGKENMVKLVAVSGDVGNYNKTTHGTITLEKGYVLAPNQEIQFLDHKLQYKWTVKDPSDGKEYAKVVVTYAGNIHDDSATWVTLGEFDDGTAKDPLAVTWFDRHNNRYGTASHSEYRTWYARFAGRPTGTYNGNIIVGKEIRAGDTFYVNAVRYDVPAVEVIDTDGNGSNGAEAFKYITLKTPLPKASTSVLIPDDGKVSSQWIDTIAPYEAIPVDPPFNGNYTMIDDINIVLWKPQANVSEWPNGTYTGPDSIGKTYWPWAERYLTMQAEEIEKEVWCENNMTVGSNWMDYFDVVEGDWVTNPELREIPNVPALRFCYVEETTEPRYRTDLHERLYEVFPETTPTAPPEERWNTTAVRTRPNAYTEFALQTRPEAETPPLTKNGDYLLVTSFLAPNSINRSDINRTIPRMAFAFDVKEEPDVLGLTPLMGDGLDLYVNRYTNVSSSIRIYGEKDIGPIGGYDVGGTYKYSDYSYPFNPAAIRKDSITFNPAIIQNKDYPSSGVRYDGKSFDAEVKEYLRMWYEPEHVYSKPTYKRPTIEVETTYLLIDRQDKLPASSIAGKTHFAFPIAEDRTTGYPKVGLELFENPEGIPTRKNLVTVSYVNGTVTNWNKTTEGVIRIEKTYTLARGETVQFLDHGITYQGINNFNQSTVDVWYMGNPDDEKVGYNVTLGTTTDPQATTWFDRHGNYQYTPNPTQFKWYAKLNSYAIPTGDTAQITVGMQLTPGDHFYVDGVRYDVAAVEVIDGDGNGSNGAELFKYITLRTPLPKRDGIFVTEAQVPDGNPDMGIDSQDIWTYPPYTTLPLNPPFNMMHDIVDDVLYNHTELSEEERIIEGYEPLNVFYVSEAIEPRYSTNMLQILDENVTGDAPIVENWTKYDVITRPDQYTEFVLPGDSARYNFTTNRWDTPLHNDYLITTSFLANNSINKSDLVDPLYRIPRAAFVFDAINLKGIYVNEIVGAPPSPPAGVPKVFCNVTPTGDVPSGTLITVCVNATHFVWPLDVKVDWGDGSPVSTGVLTSNTSTFCPTHTYLLRGNWTINQTATDIYGNTGYNISYVNVTSDGFRLCIGPGWNQFS
ncbi:hypothetical protein CW713_10240, partial [Methanophagales archaeon]